MTVPSRLALAALVACVCAVQVQSAEASLSVRTLAPVNGTVFQVGVRTGFVFEDRGSGMSILEVSRTRRADPDGVFANAAWSTGYEARRRKIVITAERSRLWSRPGTWYWHTYRIDCPLTGPGPHTCHQHVTSPTRHFRIA